MVPSLRLPEMLQSNKNLTNIILVIFQDLLDTVNAEIEVEPVPIVVIVDLKNAYTADVAAARTLRKISQKCTEKDIRLKIINVNVSFSF